MAPLVRDGEGPLDRQHVARDQRLEEVRIGHARCPRAAKVPIDDRRLRTRGGDGRGEAQIAKRARERRREVRISGVARRPARRVRARVEAVHAIDGHGRRRERRRSSDGRRIVRKLLGKMPALVVESPCDQKRQIRSGGPHDRSRQNARGRTHASAASPRVAPRERNPRGDGDCHEHVEQRERDRVRRRRQHA